MPVRVTMADVAREAGVSQMTVSRVVNDQGGVREATRQRVLDTIERMGYRPSGIARSLATRRTGTLGFVIPDVSNPFFADVARGVEQVAYGDGYHVFLCNTEEDSEREWAVLKSLEEKRVDGLVLCSSRLSEDELLEVVTWFPCAVLVNRRLVGGVVQSVLIDDHAGGWMAARHLLQSGHKAVGLLAGPEVSHSGRERARGYRAALAQAHLPYYPEWVQTCGPRPDVEGGRAAAHRLLEDHPELTALFCYNDLVAVGATQACREMGIGVPQDLAIVGYDDIPLAALVTPALTTCRVPRYELGAGATRLLLAQMPAQGPPEPGRHAEHRQAQVGGDQGEWGDRVVQPELVVRDSAPG